MRQEYEKMVLEKKEVLNELVKKIVQLNDVWFQAILHARNKEMVSGLLNWTEEYDYFHLFFNSIKDNLSFPLDNEKKEELQNMREKQKPIYQNIMDEYIKNNFDHNTITEKLQIEEEITYLSSFQELITRIWSFRDKYNLQRWNITQKDLDKIKNDNIWEKEEQIRALIQNDELFLELLNTIVDASDNKNNKTRNIV